MCLEVEYTIYHLSCMSVACWIGLGKGLTVFVHGYRDFSLVSTIGNGESRNWRALDVFFFAVICYLTDQRFKGVWVDGRVLARLNASSWAGTDDWVETVLIGGVVHPVGLAIWANESVGTNDHESLTWALWGLDGLQGTSGRSDLSVIQLISGRK